MYTQAEIIELKNRLTRLQDENENLKVQLSEYKKLDEKYKKIQEYEIIKNTKLAVGGFIIYLIGLIAILYLIVPHFPYYSMGFLAFVLYTIITVSFIAGIMTGYGGTEKLKIKEKRSLAERLGLT